MKRLGIKVTEEERLQVVAEHRCSGMWLGDGTPIGDPAYRVFELTKKYNLPPDTGLDMKTGEFVEP